MAKYILFIGPYSAVGGVSIHITRLTNLLSNNFNCLFVDESPLNSNQTEVFNLRSLNLLYYFKLIYKSDYIHIHSGLWWLRLFHITMSRLFLKRKIVLTIHSLGKSQKGFSLFATKLSTYMVDTTIVVSKEIFEVIENKKTIIKPAFIPPNLNELEKLPDEVLTLLENNKSKQIIVGNAFRLLMYNNCDLYGLDLLLELAMKIKEKNLNYKIIFVVASVRENDLLFNKYQSTIKNNLLEPILTIIPYKISFVQLILRSNLVVRPTCSDGDALTIREALFLGRPVIASDVVLRPKQTILFKNRDVNDLFLKITNVLNNQNNDFKTILFNNDIYKTIKEEYINVYN